jgi:hypothetical protein
LTELEKRDSASHPTFNSNFSITITNYHPTLSTYFTDYRYRIAINLIANPRQITSDIDPDPAVPRLKGTSHRDCPSGM